MPTSVQLEALTAAAVRFLWGEPGSRSDVLPAILTPPACMVLAKTAALLPCVVADLTARSLMLLQAQQSAATKASAQVQQKSGGKAEGQVWTGGSKVSGRKLQAQLS
jgi:hypothetical protein